VKRLVAFAALALALLPACSSGTDRPEGVVERWLISLNQGTAGEPQRFAPDRLSQGLLPGWQDCDPGALDVIEVGRAGLSAAQRHALAHALATRLRTFDVSIVPYRVEYASNVDSLCDQPEHSSAPLDGLAFVARRPGQEWRLVGLRSVPADSRLAPRVPSEGGRRIGQASGGTWLLGLLIGIGLALVSWVIVAATPEPEPLPSEIGREEGVGL
jgi:hypothetical protein